MFPEARGSHGRYVSFPEFLLPPYVITAIHLIKSDVHQFVNIQY